MVGRSERWKTEFDAVAVEAVREVEEAAEVVAEEDLVAVVVLEAEVAAEVEEGVVRVAVLRLGTSVRVVASAALAEAAKAIRASVIGIELFIMVD